MNTTTGQSKSKLTLKGEEYKKWHSRYHETINKCALKYRNQNRDEINKRARERFNNNPEYREKKIASMKRYREKKRQERQELLLEQRKLEEENSKKEMVQKVKDLALERQILLDKLKKMTE